MNAPHRIIIVEDEAALASVLQDYIHQAGMEAEVLHDGANAVQHILDSNADLVVLDIMLPGKDGLQICRELRAASDIPIILETARVDEIDRLLGLELGADDYICKPYSPRELVARIKAILRRTARIGDLPPDTALVLDEESWTATLNGIALDLTRREFQLLAAMSRRPGRVYSRAQLLDLAFPDDAEVFDRTIDSHIKNIRQKVKKIDADFSVIRSVYGVGYAFDA